MELGAAMAEQMRPQTSKLDILSSNDLGHIALFSLPSLFEETLKTNFVMSNSVA